MPITRSCEKDSLNQAATADLMRVLRLRLSRWLPFFVIESLAIWIAFRPLAMLETCRNGATVATAMRPLVTRPNSRPPFDQHESHSVGYAPEKLSGQLAIVTATIGKQGQ